MIKEIEQIIESKFGYVAEKIEKVEKVSNNTVYKITVNGQRYILKFYRSNWPEEGKISFINRTLSKNKIPNAELIEFNRDNPKHPTGYVIEREVQGLTADRISLSREQELELYIKLAEVLSEIHRISVKKFGYIGYGEADYDSMASFFDDEFDDRTDDLQELGVYTKVELQTMKEHLLTVLKQFEELPSVLCHGDLSKKNVIIQECGKIVLIDWDDAMAYNWMADIARFTFWMRMNYSEQEYSLFRNTFLKHYRTGYRKDEFAVFEKAFHIYVGLDSLSYHIHMGEWVMQCQVKKYLDELMCNAFVKNKASEGD